MNGSVGNKRFLKFMMVFGTSFWLKTGFVVIAVVFIIMGIVCLPTDLATVSETDLIPFGFAVIFGPGAWLLTNACVKIITCEEIKYPVASVNVTKDQLLQDAINHIGINEEYAVCVDGDWIAVTYDWKKNTRISFTGVHKQHAVYVKYFWVRDNRTYRQLDKEFMSSLDVNILGVFSGGANVHYGMISHHVIEYDLLSVDDNTGNTGVNKYQLNTVDITNNMHKFFADRGYKLVS